MDAPVGSAEPEAVSPASEDDASDDAENGSFIPSEPVQGVSAAVETVLGAAHAAASEIYEGVEVEARRLQEQHAIAIREELDAIAGRVRGIEADSRFVQKSLDELMRIITGLTAGVEDLTGRLANVTNLARDGAADDTPVAVDGDQPIAKEPEDEQELKRAPMIRAVQLAMAGNSRTQIDAILRDEFGLDETAPILDEALGAD